jgi:uncharacterized protein with HEPN domain
MKITVEQFAEKLNMSKKSPISIKERLRHILKETNYLLGVSKRAKNIREFENNEDMKRATERSLQIIGEAVKKLPKSITEMSQQTDWRKIAGMRDIIVHEYSRIESETVWETLTTKIPEFHQNVTKILARLNREEYLGYKNSLTTEPPNQSYIIRTRQQEEIDIAIAKAIIKEYPVKFQHVAIAEVKDIIGASDRTLELSTNSENITCSEYVTKIVALSVSKSTEKQSNNLDR